MYLEEPVATRLFTDLAQLGAPGSRLAVSFTVSGGGSVAPVSRLVAATFRVVFGRRGEAFRSWVDPDGLEPLLTGCGWTVDEVLDAPALGARHLVGSGLPTSGLSPGALVVAAHRHPLTVAEDAEV